jgi:hypothetical protein
MTETMAKVQDYPGLEKGSGYVVNNNKDDYQRALTRLKQARDARELRTRVDAMESKIDLILNFLKAQNGNQST